MSISSNLAANPRECAKCNNQANRYYYPCGEGHRFHIECIREICEDIKGNSDDIYHKRSVNVFCPTCLNKKNIYNYIPVKYEHSRTPKQLLEDERDRNIRNIFKQSVRIMVIFFVVVGILEELIL